MLPKSSLAVLTVVTLLGACSQGDEPPAEADETPDAAAVETTESAPADAEAETRSADEEFLAANASAEGVVTTESGLQYLMLEEGDGATPVPGGRVSVHYTGTLLDGTEFDSSEGGPAADFAVDLLIPGFSEALQLMKVGGRLRAFIPGNLAYGEEGASAAGIGPNALLIFEISLLGVS